MKILVTGGTGFLGSHCAAALLAAGHGVRLLVRSPEKIADVFGPLGVEIDEHVQGDMADPVAVDRALDGCDAVLHTAATMYGGEDVLRANLAGVQNVIGGAARLGIDPAIYISSVTAMFPPPGPIARLEDPIGRLHTVYGRSKTQGERYVRALQAEGAAITTLYPAGIYGPHDPLIGEGTKGLRDVLRYGWPITTGGVSIVDVRDVAAIVLACLEPGCGSRRYIAGGHFHTWPEFASLAESVTERRMRRIPLPGPLLRAAGRVLDGLRHIVSFDYPLTHEAALFATQLTPCDSSRTESELAISFRPTKETIADSIRWLVEVGELDPKSAGSLAPPH